MPFTCSRCHLSARRLQLLREACCTVVDVGRVFICFSISDRCRCGSTCIFVQQMEVRDRLISLLVYTFILIRLKTNVLSVIEIRLQGINHIWPIARTIGEVTLITG